MKTLTGIQMRYKATTTNEQSAFKGHVNSYAITNIRVRGIETLQDLRHFVCRKTCTAVTDSNLTFPGRLNSSLFKHTASFQWGRTSLSRSWVGTVRFFCSRDCCLCAVHQSVKERRHATKQRQNRNQTKQSKNNKKQKRNTTKTKQNHHHKKPLQRVKRVRRRSHRTGETWATRQTS